jgi:hypothetical protein
MTMRLSHHVADILLAVLSLVSATDPPVPPKVDPIRFPQDGQVVPPPPPVVVNVLRMDQVYVIDADKECVVLTRPVGLVKVTSKTGPLTIRDTFIDGKGVKEERTYNGKFLYLIDPVAKGEVEILVLPVGGTATDIISKKVMVGVPDPVPPTPPGPGPKPDPIVTPTALWGFVIVEETADAVAARGTLLADTMLSGLLKSKGWKWRVVDKDVVGADGNPPADVLPALNAAKGHGYPQVFLVDVKGNMVYQGDLPKTPADLVSLLKKWGQ